MKVLDLYPTFICTTQTICVMLPPIFFSHSNNSVRKINLRLASFHAQRRTHNLLLKHLTFTLNWLPIRKELCLFCNILHLLWWKWSNKPHQIQQSCSLRIQPFFIWHQKNCKNLLHLFFKVKALILLNCVLG